MLLAIAVLMTGCGERHTRVASTTYTVRAGDTLYSIAWRHGLDYRVLARWNNLPPDYRIAAGQVLYLVPRKSTGTAPAQPARPPASRYPPPPERPEAVDVWVWPAEGSWSVVQHSPTGSQGVLISGSVGAVVKAAARGKVVYTGSGLRGFGNLVIIKHTNVFLSAYGHNRAVNVKEGDEVAAGQPIAEMGLTPDQKPALYFEIRYNGQPVDPITYLPRR